MNCTTHEMKYTAREATSLLQVVEFTGLMQLVDNYRQSKAGKSARPETNCQLWVNNHFLFVPKFYSSADNLVHIRKFLEKLHSGKYFDKLWNTTRKNFFGHQSPVASFKQSRQVWTMQGKLFLATIITNNYQAWCDWKQTYGYITCNTIEFWVSSS